MRTDPAIAPPIVNEPAGHVPYVPDSVAIPEFTLQAVLVGAILGIIFGASSMYLVLKVGMTVSASIPIAVLSITLFRLFTPIFGRNATILENNIVQTTGSAGESIAFGVGVTMPALMILGYEMELTRVMLVAVLGGLLGVLMMIPLRRAFIVKQHGKLAYPEGTACADVLIVGEKGGTSAMTVFAGFGVAFIYYFLDVGLKLWKEIPERMLGFFKGAAISGEIAPHLLGVGYIIGTRISCIMVAGGVLASWVLIPAIVLFGAGLDHPIFPSHELISQMKTEDIWHSYVLYIGAGAVATGGIISMIRAMPMIIASVRSGLRDISARGSAGARFDGEHTVPRTERDLSMKFVLLGSLGIVIAIWLAPMLHMNILGAILIVLFGFLFVTVSSRLTGEIGSSSNPISGMTVATLLMTCLIFLALGWVGEGYRLTALSVAAIVCIAASNGGTTSQDLKTGYLVGATPRAQQVAILIGALTSALFIGSTLLVLNNAATVYSKKPQNISAVHIDVSDMTEKDRLHGPDAANDPNEYFVLRAKDQQYPGIAAGKYLVDSSGAIRYLVDPGINGKLDVRDNGVKVTKYNAPKAALMSLIIDGILTQKLPWSLVLLGVAIALVLELAGVPSLPFAVGVYLPLSASTPIFVGGLIRWIVDKSTARSAAEGELSPGVLLSSGYIAGGTIAGIIAALIALKINITIGDDWLGTAPPDLPDAQPAIKDWFPLLPFGLLGLFLLLVGRGWLLKPNHRAEEN